MYLRRSILRFIAMNGQPVRKTTKHCPCSVPASQGHPRGPSSRVSARHWVGACLALAQGWGKTTKKAGNEIFRDDLQRAEAGKASTSKVLRHFLLDHISPRFLTHNTLLTSSLLLERKTSATPEHYSWSPTSASASTTQHVPTPRRRPQHARQWHCQRCEWLCQWRRPYVSKLLTDARGLTCLEHPGFTGLETNKPTPRQQRNPYQPVGDFLSNVSRFQIIESTLREGEQYGKQLSLQLRVLTAP